MYKNMSIRQTASVSAWHLGWTMAARVTFLTLAVILTFTPGLGSPLHPREDFEAEPVKIGFGHLLGQFCILKDDQTASHTDRNGCIALLAVCAFLLALLLLHLLILLFCCCCCYCCKRKTSQSTLTVDSETEADSDSDTSMAEAHYQKETHSVFNRIRSFLTVRGKHDYKLLRSKRDKQYKGKGNESMKMQPRGETDDVEPTKKKKSPIRDEEESEEEIGDELQTQPGAIGGILGVEIGFVEDEKKQERDKVRVKQEKDDKGNARNVSKLLFKGTFKKFESCNDLGSRLQKYWFRRGGKEKEWSALQFTEKKSLICQVSLNDPKTLSDLNDLFSALQHPHLLQVFKVAEGEDWVSIVQMFVPQGSLRDIIYQVDPLLDWSDKYTNTARIQILDKDEIILCCRHILEAILFLYEVGFPAIGQIHTGNVFKVDGRYVLGGYENTLLGFRTSQYESIEYEELLDHIDAVMFGHMVYEMGSGVFLPEVFPKADFTYEKITDLEVRKFVKQIFTKCAKKSRKKAVKQIRNLEFLKGVPFSKEKPPELSQDAMNLLVQIREGKGHQDLDIIKLTEDLADYMQRIKLDRIGWRSSKVWAVTTGEVPVLMSADVVPYTCPIIVQKNLKAINDVIESVQPHPHIHSIIQLRYKKVDKLHITISVEKLLERSLKDYIYQSDPLHGWKVKYRRAQRKFTADEIAKYGAQVLDALLFLYHIGFPPVIGQVTTRNIYLDEGVCRLGGWENVLLGHRTESYSSLKEIAGQFLDVFMFGLVVMEMATQNVTKSAPEQKDYKSAPKEVKDILDYIFELKHSVKEVRQHSFFRGIEATKDYDQVPKPLSPNAKDLLHKVNKAKQKKQDDTGSKIKEKTHRLMRSIKH